MKGGNALSMSQEVHEPDMVDASRAIRLVLAPGIELQPDGPHVCLLRTRVDVTRCVFPDAFVPEALSLLATSGLPLRALKSTTGDSARDAFLTEQVMRLWRAGMLAQALADSKWKATLRGGGHTRLFPPHVSVDRVARLTQGAFARVENGIVRLESVQSGEVVELDVQAGALLLPKLIAGESLRGIVESTGLSAEFAQGIVGWLVGIGVVSQDGADGEAATMWSFADRLMHARSRLATHVGGYGGTYRFRGTLPEPPALRPNRAAERVVLPKPDMERVAATDPPLTSVVEGRVSIREHAAEPLSLSELGEFLYRSARIREQSARRDAPALSRPHPGGGGLYELEFYPVINCCDGVPRGLYRYDGVAHELERVSTFSHDVHRLIDTARHFARFQGSPHILIVLAARFPRVNWKYESIAYSVILKDVGVVLQTMYLVATAMGLAPCAVGGGDAAQFARAASVDFWEEGSVGEFLLGRRVSRGSAF
jgi:SagB-type dehydrogenase family enzyme